MFYEGINIYDRQRKIRLDVDRSRHTVHGNSVDLILPLFSEKFHTPHDVLHPEAENETSVCVNYYKCLTKRYILKSSTYAQLTPALTLLFFFLLASKHKDK